ncbi:MAG: BT_3987 domain-containing protein [Flavisolibacter sp.]
MKIRFKIYWTLATIIGTGILMSSCNKPNLVTYNKEGTIYMPRAAGNNSKMSLLLADTPQVVIFGAAYGGLNYPSKDISVKFAIDSTSINQYNSQNGTAYTLLPSNSYVIPSMDAVIKSGSTSSDALAVKITTKNLDRTLKYILPVMIQSVSSGTVDSSLRTTYFLIDTIQRLEKDITGKATLTVAWDNGGGPDAGEGSKKLVDGDNNTKFLIGGYSSNFWVQLQFPSPQVVGAYTITSGNDAPERDPKDWQLVGSNDGNTWTVLDNRVGEVFPNRNQVRRFEFNNSTAYNYYRMNITADGGSNLLQISEWRLITYP